MPKQKPMIGLDNLYLILYTHRVLDRQIYDDERQRVQVATGLLAAVFKPRWKNDIQRTRIEILKPRKLRLSMNRRRRERYRERREGCW